MSDQINNPVLAGKVLGKKKKPGTFEKGDPRINRNGRAKGVPNPSAMLIKQATQGLVQDALTNIEIAIKAGDTKLSQWLIEIFSPQRLMEAISLEIPNIKTSEDLLEANNIVNEALFSGDLSAMQSNEYGKRLEDTRKMYQTVLLEKTMDKIEDVLRNK